MKHAYLIMAHKNWGQLQVLLSLLDDRRNDIYIHFDKKQEPSLQVIEEIKASVTNSQLIIVRNVPVNWGGYSIVEVELRLLKEAAANHHGYYHLLSGMDLPLKTQDDIHRFFADHSGKEFIHFGKDQWHKKAEDRYGYYWLFPEVGRNFESFWSWLNRYFVKVQKKAGLKRYKGEGSFAGGSQWFSITDGLAQYICSHEKTIKKRFRFTWIPDEAFLQTIVAKSDFMKHVYVNQDTRYIDTNMRYIDWQRGNPYIFKSDDYNRLMDSGCLFARKFDETVDNRIINMIRETLSGMKNNGNY